MWEAIFVGSGHIHAVVPVKLRLSFGTEDRKKSNVVWSERNYESVGLGRRTFRYTFEFEATVTNFTDTPRTSPRSLTKSQFPRQIGSR